MQRKSYYTGMKRMIRLNMILVPLIPVILILGIGYYYFKASLESHALDSTRRIVQDHRTMLESFLNERTADLKHIADTYTLAQLNEPHKIHDVFKRLQAHAPAFSDLGVFNSDGDHLAYSGPYDLTGKKYNDAKWFQEVMQQSIYISDIFLGYRNVPHFVIAITSTSGGEEWVLRATIDSMMFTHMVEQVRIGKTGEAFILNTDLVLQTQRRSGGNFMETPPEKITYPSPQEGIQSFYYTAPQGQYIYTTTWMKHGKWLLVVRQDTAEVFEKFRSAAYLILIINLIGGGLTIFIALLISDRIVRRMQEVDMEKNRMSDQLIQASRLAELGEMSAGFAHEINNPLQIITNEQSLMRMNLDEFKKSGQIQSSDILTEIEDSMNQVAVQIQRCAEITQSILKFGRQKESQPTKLDLKAFIPEVIDMVEKKANVHGIQIVRSIADSVPAINGDATQLQQVLLNLFNNAIDAVIQKFGSRGGEVSLQCDTDANGQVMIRLTDNGCGIDPENQQKIFRPFFTTKPVGKGTGLGLSVCYGIIQKLGGTMTVHSTKGEGSVFTVTLPPYQG